MSADNDLIRRGDVLDAMCKGPRTVQERIDAIRALATPDQPAQDEQCPACGTLHPNTDKTCPDCKAEYACRASQVTHPDPRDEVIAGLVGALTLARNRLQVCALDHPMNTLPQIERSEWGREATAAIAAAKAVQP